jgi:hypothetical protein
MSRNAGGVCAIGVRPANAPVEPADRFPSVDIPRIQFKPINDLLGIEEKQYG